MPEASIPEILRISMTSSMLQLKCLGQDIETLDFMDKPDSDSSKDGLRLFFSVLTLAKSPALSRVYTF